MGLEVGFADKIQILVAGERRRAAECVKVSTFIGIVKEHTSEYFFK